MKDELQEKIVVILFSFILIGVFIINIIIPDKEISKYERRKLAKFPSITLKEVKNASYMKKLDDYTVDQFMFRDSFRKIKNYFELDFLNKKDINNSFIYNNSIYKIEYPLNIKSIHNATNKINFIKSKYLKNNNIYYTIIPDKNYYLDKDFLKLDYDKLVDMVDELLDIKYIDIFDILSLDDYYRTDLHWDASKILKVKNYLNDEMGNLNNNLSYNISSLGDLYGAYYGNILKDIKPDKISYLTNDVIDSLYSYNYETKSYKKLYDMDKANNVDRYDMFLSGPCSVIEINNDNGVNDKELIIFRDSFGSSIAPLFALDYKKVTLVDIRYINSKILDYYVDFKDQDVLFMYSVPIINNSFSFK